MKYFQSIFQKIAVVKSLSRKQALICGVITIVILASVGVALVTHSNVKPQRPIEVAVEPKEEPKVEKVEAVQAEAPAAQSAPASPAPKPKASASPEPVKKTPQTTKPSARPPRPAPGPLQTMIWFGPAPVEGSFEFQSSTASPGGYLMAIVSPTGNVAYKSNPTTGQGGTFSVDESDFEEVGTYALWACINNGGVCGVVSNTVHVTVSLTED